VAQQENGPTGSENEEAMRFTPHYPETAGYAGDLLDTGEPI
jgi:hypothetical protein